MPYIYEISFDIPGSNFGQMRLGESIQTALAYMRALLPNEPGFITSRGMYSISHVELTHIVFESVWEDWDSLLHHRSDSRLNLGNLINEFKLEVEPLNLTTHVFREID